MVLREVMKQKFRLVLFFLVMVILLLIIIVKLDYLLAIFNKIQILKIGTMDMNRVCASSVAVDKNRILILGGYNNKKINKVVSSAELFDLRVKHSKKIFDSNFDNSFGNILFKQTFPDNNEIIIANLQPIKFDKNSQYGLEIYDIDKKKLKRIANAEFSPRQNFQEGTYFYDTNSFRPWTSDEQILYLTGGLDYKTNQYNNQIEYFDFKKMKSGNYKVFDTIQYGIGSYMLAGGKNITTNKPIKDIKLIDDYKTIGFLYDYMFSPAIYKMTLSFSNDNDGYLFVDKNNQRAPIQIFFYNPEAPVNFAQKVNIPNILKKANIYKVIQIDQFRILFLFQKDNNIYIAIYKNGHKKLDVIGRFNPICKYSTYQLVSYSNENKVVKILAIGGIKANDVKHNFQCGDAITNPACNEIYLISFKL